jgi:hypothetical protein
MCLSPFERTCLQLGSNAPVVGSEWELAPFFGFDPEAAQSYMPSALAGPSSQASWGVPELSVDGTRPQQSDHDAAVFGFESEIAQCLEELEMPSLIQDEQESSVAKEEVDFKWDDLMFE